MTTAEPVQLPLADRCGHCQQIETPNCTAPVKPGGDCSVCQLLGATCSFKIADTTVADLNTAIKKASEPVLPKTESEKEAELNTIYLSRKGLDFKQKKLFCQDITGFAAWIVEKYWKWIIFFYPTFGMLTPLLIIAFAVLLQETFPRSKDRAAVEEEIQKLNAREVVLLNTKIKGNECSVLELLGVMFLVVVGAFVVIFVAACAGTLLSGKR